MRVNCNGMIHSLFLLTSTNVLKFSKTSFAIDCWSLLYFYIIHFKIEFSKFRIVTFGVIIVYRKNFSKGPLKNNKMYLNFQSKISWMNISCINDIYITITNTTIPKET